MEISYRNNIFNNDFNNFNAFLAILISSGDFKACLKASFNDILCHVEVTHLTFNEGQLTGFSMVRVFTERKRCFRADFHFSFNVNVNVICQLMTVI